MDCRTAFLVGLSLLAGGGCMTVSGPGGSESRVAAEKRAIAESKAIQESQASSQNGQRRTPKAESLIAWANSCELQASSPNLSNQEQRHFRDEARQRYQKALEIDPDNKEAHLQLARLYVKAGDDDRAMEMYRKAQAKFPREAAIHYDLGMVQCKKKDWNGAINHLTKAHELDPENREVGTKLGLTLARAGRAEQAVACLAPFQGKAEACFSVARMMQHLGQPEASKQWLRQALQSNPNLQPAQQMLASLEGQGNGAQGVVRIGFEQEFPN